MSDENVDLPDIHYFLAPYGYYQKDPDVKEYSGSDRLSRTINEMLNEGPEKVKGFAKDFFHNVEHMEYLYNACSNPDNWKYSEAGNREGYTLTTQASTLQVVARDVPSVLMDGDALHGKLGTYVHFEVENRANQLCYVFGVGFYVDDNGTFTEQGFRRLLLEIVKDLCILISANAPYTLPDLNKSQDTMLNLQQRTLDLVAGRKFDYGIPKPVIRMLTFISDPTWTTGINIAEDMVIDLVPGVMGKIVAYFAFQLLNYFFTDYHHVRYLVINRSLNSFKFDMPYSKHTSSDEVPDILSNPDLNIMHRVHETAAYHDNIHSESSVTQTVFNIPSFVIKSDEFDPPHILLRMSNAGFDGPSSPTDEYISNISSAYKVDESSYHSNKQGILIDADYNEGARQVYDQLIADTGGLRKVESNSQNCTINQMTNTLDGYTYELDYVVIVIDENT